MSESRTKLEQILELLLSEDTEKAEAALHEYVVGKAREEYLRVLDESDDEFGDEEIDQTGDFEDEITADQDEIHSDETGEDDFADDEFADDGEDFADDQMDDAGFDDDVEDRVDSIEAELEDLRAEFERLMTADMDDMGDDMGDDMDDMGDDMGDEDFDDMEELEEATKLSDKAPAAKDGESQSDSSANHSPYSKAPAHTRIQSQGKPVHAKDGSDGKDSHGGSKKHQNPTDRNINVPHKRAAEPKKGE
jgi:hypothetical protein